MTAAALVAMPAGAAVNAHTSTDHYSIRGTTAVELRAQMNARGPGSAGGGRFDGYTNWYVSWRYTYRRGASCAIERVTTEVRVATTLPHWTDEAHAGAALREQWRRYIAALALHEEGHARNGLDAAQEIDAALARLPPQPDCDAMGARANGVANGILRKYNERDLEYDAQTGHGATQGARFP